MSNGMQLISALFFALSLLSLVGAVLFVAIWYRSCRLSTIVCRMREGIAHIGVSAVVEYPETSAPLIALLEEEYPRSEAIVITDMQHPLYSLGELVGRYHLIRVNHTHLEGVRALYRSRHRAFRRVVLVDLPTEYRGAALDVGKRVASYDYVLHLQGESIVERNAITYCANLLASQHSVTSLSLRSIVGSDAHLEKATTKRTKDYLRLRTNHALAWQKRGRLFAIVALLLPTAMALTAWLFDSVLMFVSAVVSMVAVGLFLYVSCRVVTEKGLFLRLDTMLRNFYRYLVETVRNFHYLYKESKCDGEGLEKGLSVLRNRQRRDNRNAL